MSASAIHDAFVSQAGTLTNLTLSVEGNLGPLPTFTLSPLLPLQEDVETGPAMQVTYRWLMRLYVANDSIDQAQTDLFDLAQLVYRVPRLDRTLDGTCDFCMVEPRDDEIQFMTELAVARLLVTAETDEA